MTRQPGIYAITHETSGNMYIGSAVALNHRWRVHASRLRKGTHHNKHLQHAWNKYGADEFSFDVIEFVNESTHLILREQVWLDFFKPAYNTCRVAGSPLGTKHSEETIKKKVGRVTPVETREKIAAALRGRKCSEQHKARISAAKKGTTFSEDAKAKMSKAGLGKKLPIQTRDRMSEARKGRVFSEETKDRISTGLRRYYSRLREVQV